MRWICCFLFVLMLGCSPKIPTDDVQLVSPGSASLSLNLNGTEIELDSCKVAELLTWIKQQSAPYVIVDCWATYCEPCKREFHHLVELSQQYPLTKLQTVSLCMEYDADLNQLDEASRIGDFLANQKATKVKNLFLSMDSDDAATELKIDGVPAVLVYNKQGELLKKFDGKFTYEQVKEYLATLLK